MHLWHRLRSFQNLAAQMGAMVMGDPEIQQIVAVVGKMHLLEAGVTLKDGSF